MSYSFAVATSGAAAAMLVVVLAVLRLRRAGSKVGLRLAIAWVRMPALYANSILGGLAGLVALALAGSGGGVWKGTGGLTGSAAAETSGLVNDGTKFAATDQDETTAHALESLRDFAARINDKQQSIAALSDAGSQNADGATLPNVDTMITRLAERLDKNPDDVKGWTMLGWSYINTGRPEQAAQAYERALKLEPENAEIKQALATAKATPAASENKVAAEAAGPDSAMVRGMVERLASRLETAPHDEDGWKRLMRARTVIGEKETARSDFKRALAAFSGEKAVQARLTEWASGLGIATN